MLALIYGLGGEALAGAALQSPELDAFTSTQAIPRRKQGNRRDTQLFLRPGVAAAERGTPPTILTQLLVVSGKALPAQSSALRRLREMCDRKSARRAHY